MDHNKALGKAIAEQRARRRMSQEVLASVSDLNRTYVSLVERGENSPTLNTIVALCKGLDIDFGTLAKRTQELIDSD